MTTKKEISFTFPSLDVINKLITRKHKIEIVFDFPLVYKVSFYFKKKKGFTTLDIYKLVSDTYKKLYKTPNKYHIYGHDITDLCLVGFTETKPGTFYLHIDS